MLVANDKAIRIGPVEAPSTAVHVRATPRFVPWTAAQAALLRSALATALAPGLNGASDWSLSVVDARGRLLYGARARHAVEPASVLKLIVATSALDIAGARFRYHTVVAATSDQRDGTIAGDLWLIGSGDPSLRSGDLQAGARALVRSGVRRVAGNVRVDASAFSGPEVNPLWSANDANEDFQAPVSALSLDEGTVEFDIFGTKPGQVAEARMRPWSNAIHANGSVMTVAPGGDPSVTVAALSSPNTFALSGEVPAGSVDREWVPVHDEPYVAGSVFVHILNASGIEAGPTKTGLAPANRAVLWDHASASLRSLVRQMLYVSDNHYAEQVSRTLGVLRYGVGDDAHALAAEREDLNARGIPTPGLRLADGSGLAVANRVAAITLAEVLAHALALAPERGFFDLLPQGGRSGTVGKYPFTSALGRVRAKTGHLSGVASLAGYVKSRHHGLVIFSFEVNGSPGDPDAAMVRAVDAISKF